MDLLASLGGGVVALGAMTVAAALKARAQRREILRDRRSAASEMELVIDSLAAMAEAGHGPPHRLLPGAKAQKAIDRDGVLAEQTRDLQKRVRAIEDRLPERVDIDKIASINEALLAKAVEDLRAALTRLEDRTPTKWDVATVVFAVLAGLGALVALVVGVAKLAA